MVQIAADPRAVKNIRVKIGANNYELHVQSVKFGRTAPRPVTWQGGTPEAQYSDSTPSTDHVANIKLAHDYQTADSAYNFFRANEGLEAVLEYKPDADGAYTETATITIVSPDPGGEYGVFHESTIACPSTAPVASFTAPAAPTITGLVPDEVAAAGGDDLVIKGTGFASATVVEIGGASVPFTMLSSTLILVEGTPAHAAGAVDVEVTNPTGTSAAEALTYV
jgi:hypothetical protein